MKNVLTNKIPFTITGTKQFTFESEKNRLYQILVFIPNEAPPETGFPIIYLLDGNSIFGSVVEAVRIQSRKPEKTGVIPSIVVGVGYSTSEPFSKERFYDYTMGEPEIEIPANKMDNATSQRHGGAEEFLQFLQNKLKPAMEQNYPIDQKKQTLFGHSLGGLFVLHTLFTSPTSFQTYIAGSPSIHWNQSIILEEERLFHQLCETGEIKANVLVGIGELERWHHTNVGELAKSMVDRLSTRSCLKVEFIQFENEGHVSVLPPLISRSLRFALG
ncbi:alpha/beta hydrolase [Metabacillus halosaccharovorans]|uniref:alpha/beta hydrolase n=1 Tax=Metabacillus halosaccharovorans TaxID=930124 RepID=UPI000995BA24|nr:alpha/beta hydrolase-fold protein [Metabacillus halosaccharovorans]